MSKSSESEIPTESKDAHLNDVENQPVVASTETRSKRTTNRGLYAALIASVGVAAFFAGLAIPGLNSDPISMSDLQQAVLFLENKIDNLSNEIQTLEDTVTVASPDDSPTQPAVAISPDDDPVLGDINAPITMIEFSDYQCPFCARFHSETLPLIKENYIDTGMVKMVYRDFPLESIHPNAVPAAIAAECADDQNEYWQYHDMLFGRMVEWADLGTDDLSTVLKNYAADLDLDVDLFSDCIDSGSHISEVRADYQDGIAYGVTGTPAFFLGNEQVGYYPISGARPYSEFQFAFEQLLSIASQ